MMKAILVIEIVEFTTVTREENRLKFTWKYPGGEVAAVRYYGINEIEVDESYYPNRYYLIKEKGEI